MREQRFQERRMTPTHGTSNNGYAGRVLCVTSNFPRWEGDSTTPFILHLAQDLQELGWRIDVIAPHAPEAAIRETIGGVRVERFPYLWPPRLETVCYQGGALVNLRRNPSNTLKLPALVLCEWAGIIRRAGAISIGQNDVRNVCRGYMSLETVVEKWSPETFALPVLAAV